MEANRPQQPENAAEELNLVDKVRANRKLIVGLSVLVIVILVAILAVFFITQRGSRNADEMIAKADMEQNDSIALVLYKEAAECGYASGDRAKAEVAIRLYRDGKYEEALGYLDGASADDNIVAAGIYSLKGDCYVNLDKNAEALDCYKKAVSKADKNPSIVTLVLIKEANIYRAEGNFEQEYEAYNTIINEYPEFARSSQNDIRKYYERARIAAGK